MTSEQRKWLAIVAVSVYEERTLSSGTDKQADYHKTLLFIFVQSEV